MNYRTLIVAIVGLISLVIVGALKLDASTTTALVAGIVGVVTAQAGKSGVEAVARAKAAGIEPAAVAAQIVAAVTKARAKPARDEDPPTDKGRRP